MDCTFLTCTCHSACQFRTERYSGALVEQKLAIISRIGTVDQEKLDLTSRGMPAADEKSNGIALQRVNMGECLVLYMVQFLCQTCHGTISLLRRLATCYRWAFQRRKPSSATVTLRKYNSCVFSESRGLGSQPVVVKAVLSIKLHLFQLEPPPRPPWVGLDIAPWTWKTCEQNWKNRSRLARHPERVVVPVRPLALQQMALS